MFLIINGGYFYLFLIGVFSMSHVDLANHQVLLKSSSYLEIHTLQKTIRYQSYILHDILHGMLYSSSTMQSLYQIRYQLFLSFHECSFMLRLT